VRFWMAGWERVGALEEGVKFCTCDFVGKTKRGSKVGDMGCDR